MYCSEAEEILSQRCPNFYRKFKKEHENDDTVVFPIPEDKFDCTEKATPERLYWEGKLRTDYRGDYEFYRLCGQVNAFVFYVGCAVRETNSDVAAELGNYKALRQQYQADPSDALSWRIQELYPQAGDLLRAIEFCEKLRGSKPGSKDHQELVEQTIDRLDCAVAYESHIYNCCVQYDPTLLLSFGEVLKEFLNKKLITLQDLDRRGCACYLKQEDDGKEPKKAKGVTLAY